ncbi:hypothetical protein [Pseudomonas sp. JZ134]|uniref:hypothetical protein n=1 Tax=Pseudomonas sp. JZ134 TaxID=2806615 RepID=UPI003DA06823
MTHGTPGIAQGLFKVAGSVKQDSDMYQDSKRIRKNRATINLDDYEQALINALVDYTGLDQATLLRQLAMQEARELLLPQNMLGQASA